MSQKKEFWSKPEKAYVKLEVKKAVPLFRFVETDQATIITIMTKYKKS